MKRGQPHKHEKPLQTCPSCGSPPPWRWDSAGMARIGKKGRMFVRGEGSKLRGRKGKMNRPAQSLRVYYKANTTATHVSRRFAVCPDPWHGRQPVRHRW